MINKNHIVIIGAGPGGYTAAFRGSDLGNKVTLIEKDDVLGGVCLNRGCIPSKTLLHLSKIINETESLKKAGIQFSKLNIDMIQMILLHYFITKARRLQNVEWIMLSGR